MTKVVTEERVRRFKLSECGNICEIDIKRKKLKKAAADSAYVASKSARDAAESAKLTKG